MKYLIIIILSIITSIVAYARELGYDINYMYRGMKGVATYEYEADINGNAVLDGNFFYKTVTDTGEITISGTYVNGERNGIWTLQETVAGIDYRTEVENYDNGILNGDASTALMPIKQGDICVVTQKQYTDWVLSGLYNEIHINPLTKYLSKEIDVSFADNENATTIYGYEHHCETTDTVISGQFRHRLATGTWETYIRDNEYTTKERAKYLNGVKYYSIVEDMKKSRIVSQYPKVAKDTIEVKQLIEGSITYNDERIVTASPMHSTPYIIDGTTIGYTIDMNKEDEMTFSDTPSIEFPGGEEMMKRYISDTLIYPSTALKAEIEGTVGVTFTISPRGEICNATVIQSISPELDAEAVRIIRALPDFTNNTHSATSYTLPITFSISDYNSKK